MSSISKAQALLKSAGITIGGSHAFDPQVNDVRLYRRVLLWGSLGLGDGYVDGQWDCERLDIFFEKALRARLEYSVGRFVDFFDGLRNRVLNLQSVRRALQVAEHHYDLGNSLFEAMLGESMAYSSGFWRGGAQNLDEAQYAKFDRICKKLDLKPGMRVLEIGCGWGSFAAWAAQKYGVEVVGVTVSKEQMEYAQRRCEGLPVMVYFGDYRELPAVNEGGFDRVVSIEMVEAVGTKNLRTYMKVAARCLKPEGRFLIQVIVGSGIADVWLSIRIFPNGILPSLTQLRSAARNIFRFADIESFGLDYDRTLMAWDERFRAHWPQIRELRDQKGAPVYDDRFYRMWHYYLMVCAGAFRSEKIDVSQIVLEKLPH